MTTTLLPASPGHWVQTAGVSKVGEVFRYCRPVVGWLVRVDEDDDGDPKASGLPLVVDPEGDVVSAWHLDKDTHFEVCFFHGGDEEPEPLTDPAWIGFADREAAKVRAARAE